MKKLLILLLALILMLPLCGCEKDKPIDDNNNNDNTDNSSFSKVVAVDNQECSIVIKGVDLKNSAGLALKAELINKSGSKTLMFSIKEATINGVDCETMFSWMGAPKEKYNDDIVLLSNLLKENGVGDFTDIQITFFVYDVDNWEGGAVALETVHIYPYGQDKASKYVREEKPSDNVIVDNDYVKVVVVSYDPNGQNGYTVTMFLVNKTDNIAMFAVYDSYINGTFIYPYWVVYVSRQGCAFSSITWSPDSLKEKGIKEVEKIAILLEAVNYENWQGDYYVKETFTLIP
ncbi:MAG TPA: hypothetical protein PLI19_05130 [Erysipelotrichaceae bacterium]|nr:hypothetical protein [Erysipelotrichaceae bacterium]